MSRLRWIDSSRDKSWLPGLRAVALLLRAGQPVLMQTAAAAGEPYLAVRDLTDSAAEWLRHLGVTLVDGPGSPEDGLRGLWAPAAAVFGGAGSPYNHASALAALGIPWFYVTGPDIAAGALQHADVLVVSGGGWRHGNGQLADLGEDGTQAVLRFVEGGGGYLASCAGSHIAMRLPDVALRSCHPTKAAFTLLDIENWEPLREGEGGHRSPGIGRVATGVATPAHPVALGLPERLDMTHYNGPIFAEPPDEVATVVRFTGPKDAFTPSECFFGRAGRPTAADRAGSLMAEAGRRELPAVVAAERGHGRVVLAGLHPEFGLGRALDTWSRPVQLVGNAVLWQSQFGRGVVGSYHLPVGSIADAQAGVERGLTEGREAVRRLQEADQRVGPEWQAASTLRGAFGCTPHELWRGAVDGLMGLVDRIDRSWIEARQVAGESRTARLAGVALARYEPEGGPDLGAQGAIWLIEEATRLIDKAIKFLDTSDDCSDAEEAVSRSYLSAVGVLTNAAQRIESETATYTAEDDLEHLKGILAETAAGVAV